MRRWWFGRGRDEGPRAGDAPHDALIDLRSVVKTFESAAGTFTALKGVSIHIRQGEFAAIIGKSGSGKSTLMNMITGIDRPTSGEVYVAGAAVHSLDESRMAAWRGRNVGIVFQFFQLLPALALVENVMLPMEICGLYTPRARRTRAMALLEQVGMAAHAHKLPAAISGGQQQRVAIARALANDPPIIMADEPTGNLDSRTATTIFELFAQLAAQGKTVVMVTHDSDFAKFVDRSVIVADGEIINEHVARALAALNIDQLSWVAERLEARRCGPGTVILREGDEADRFYIITGGEVEIFIERGVGGELVIDRLKPGQYFGEMGLIGDGRRTASARVPAGGEVELATIDREAFLAVLAESAAVNASLSGLAKQRAIRLQQATQGAPSDHGHATPAAPAD